MCTDPRPYVGLLAAAVLTIVAAPPSRAAAYRTAEALPEVGAAAMWAPASVPFLVDRRLGPLTTSDAGRLVDDAFRAWEDAECSAPQFRYAGVATGDAARGDGLNAVGWVESGWSALGLPPDAAATTEVRYRSTGTAWEIVEADVYINAELFLWSIDGSEAGTRSLIAALRHEAGHVLGLLHPCEIGGADDAPACAPADEVALMYPLYGSRTELATDDREGLCALYPALSCSGIVCPSVQVCHLGRCVDPCADVTCPAGTFCASGECEPCTPATCRGTCSSDLDCDASGMSCVAGECLAGTGVLGDPCGHDGDCASSVCSPDGACSVRCSSGWCPEHWECDEPTQRCLAARGTIGTLCETGDECVNGLCFLRDGVGACTRPCEAGCPTDFVCSSVMGREICVPPRPLTPSCNAAVGAGRERSVARIWLLAFAALYLIRCSRRVGS